MTTSTQSPAEAHGTEPSAWTDADIRRAANMSWSDAGSAETVTLTERTFARVVRQVASILGAHAQPKGTEDAAHALLAILGAAGEGATVADVLDRLSQPKGTRCEICDYTEGWEEGFKAAKAQAHAPAHSEPVATLPVEIWGKFYEVPIPVSLRLTQLQQFANDAEATAYRVTTRGGTRYLVDRAPTEKDIEDLAYMGDGLELLCSIPKMETAAQPEAQCAAVGAGE